MTAKNILILPGDGIGPEIIDQAIKVLTVLRDEKSVALTWELGLIGGASYDKFAQPFTAETLNQAKQADAVLLGAVGGYQWDNLPRELRPEKGLLALRAGLGLYANLRPALLYPMLASASTLRADVVAGLDLMIVRELTGGIYFGQPRGIRTLENGEQQGFNTLVYSESEIQRIAHMAFKTAMKRQNRLCSVDKANVLESSQLWRDVMETVAKDYPSVELSHLYVDNAAMQLVLNPKQFDVMVTGNLFGDILSDCAAMLTGSIGMLPSASMNDKGQGMYEPIHGSAPDIAGKGLANPLATILSVAMMLRYSLQQSQWADRLEQAVVAVLKQGLRTADIQNTDQAVVDTSTMGDAVVTALRELA